MAKDKTNSTNKKTVTTTTYMSDAELRDIIENSPSEDFGKFEALIEIKKNDFTEIVPNSIISGNEESEFPLTFEEAFICFETGNQYYLIVGSKLSDMSWGSCNSDIANNLFAYFDKADCYAVEELKTKFKDYTDSLITEEI